MKTIILIILMLFTTASVFTQTVYDPPSSYTSHYRLRMWDEGDRPGADSVNQNLKDIDYQLYLVNLKADRVYTEGHTFTAANSFTSNTNSFNGSEYKLSGTNINTAGTLSNVAYLNANNVFSGHLSLADHITITADDATSYINMTGTDNALLKFNGNTFMTWNATQMTIPGIISATGWKTGSTTTYMTSALFNHVVSGYYVANELGGEPTVQLDKVSLTINGVTYEFLTVPK